MFSWIFQMESRRVLDGEAILFTGAGFSRGAVNLLNAQLKTSTQLADHFATKANLPPGTQLDDAAEQYYDDFGADALIREIQDEYSVKSVAPYHRYIASLPWKRIYTTNYDNVFEFASSQEGINTNSVTLSNDIFNSPMQRRVCVAFEWLYREA